MAKIIIEIEDITTANGRAMVSVEWGGDFKVPHNEDEFNNLTAAQRAALSLNHLVSSFDKSAAPPSQRLS